MTEADLKGKLMELARKELPSFVIQRHEDKYIHGKPDFSVDGNKIGSWYEVKHATPNFKNRGIQELTMLRLERASRAFYIIYWEKNNVRRTYIVPPSKIGAPIEEWGLHSEGFDHRWVIEFIKEIHNVNNNRS